MEKLPLRERKKIQTRQRILQAAEQLASSKGYQAVTIAAICEKADIAQRTFFAYFTSKEAVFFYAKQSLLEELTTLLRNRPKNQTTFQVLRELLVSRISDLVPENGKGYMHIEKNSPQLQMYSEHLDRVGEDILRENLARDLHKPVDSLGPMLAAATANSTLCSIIKRAEEDKSMSKKETLESLDKTLLFLEAGLVALDKTNK